MFQHMSQESESSLENDFRLKQEGIIIGKVDGLYGDPPNLEQYNLVQNKKPKEKTRKCLKYYANVQCLHTTQQGKNRSNI